MAEGQSQQARGCLKIIFELAFFMSEKNRASLNFAKSELARLPIFLYLRE